jgi:hypothetical protein
MIDVGQKIKGGKTGLCLEAHKAYEKDTSTVSMIFAYI